MGGSPLSSCPFWRFSESVDIAFFIFHETIVSCDYCGWWTLLVSYHTVSFCSHRPHRKGNIMFLICHVDLRNHVIEDIWLCSFCLCIISHLKKHLSLFFIINLSFKNYVMQKFWTLIHCKSLIRRHACAYHAVTVCWCSKVLRHVIFEWALNWVAASTQNCINKMWVMLFWNRVVKL